MNYTKPRRDELVVLLKKAHEDLRAANSRAADSVIRCDWLATALRMAVRQIPAGTDISRIKIEAARAGVAL